MSKLSRFCIFYNFVDKNIHSDKIIPKKIENRWNRFELFKKNVTTHSSFSDFLMIYYGFRKFTSTLYVFSDV